MGYRKMMELRPHVGIHSFLMELIGTGRCWHFDAWIERIGDTYYLRTETRAGGRDVLQRNYYRLYPNTASPLHYVPRMPPGASERITLQDRGLPQDDCDALNAIHWSHIRPMLQRRPDAYTSTSAAFHYIRAPSLEPIEDAQNFFRYGT